MEVELQKQDFKAIENLETNLRLQKNEVCVQCHRMLKKVFRTLTCCTIAIYIARLMT